MARAPALGAAPEGPSRQSIYGWAAGSKCSLTRLTKTLRLASVQPSWIISAVLRPGPS
jgi:hypothetical protein